jgi:hypothetical protein
MSEKEKYNVPADIMKMMSWGQYIHWSNIQYQNFKNNLNDDDEYVIHIGTQSHWMASLYVVVEGWLELGLSDPIINKILHSYPDYTLLLKRCRNAVYHFQKKQLDKRIVEALEQAEFLPWMEAIREEFERYLFMFPYQKFGFSKESVDLHTEYFECIGWKPTDSAWVRWFSIYAECLTYKKYQKTEKLQHSTENDTLIKETLKKLKDITPHPCLSLLTRLHNKAE